MDLLFSSKFRYTKYETLERVREEFKHATRRRIFDFPENISGKLQDDDHFQFTHAWSFSFIRGFETNPAYINGFLKSEETKTRIYISVRPNISFILLFYALAFFFIYRLFQENVFVDEDSIILQLILLFFIAMIYSIIKATTNGLRRNFERMFLLRIINEEH